MDDDTKAQLSALERENDTLRRELAALGRDLEGEKQRFDSFVGAAPIGIIVLSLGPGSEVLFANKHAMTVFGYPSRDEVVGVQFRDFLVPDARQTINHLFDKLRQGSVSGSHTVESLALRHDGATFSLRMNLSVIPWGATQAYLAYVHDVTDQRRAVESLRLNETRMAALYNLSGMMDAGVGEMISFAMQQIVDLTRSSAGFIHFLDEEEKEVTRRFWSRDVEQACRLSLRSAVCPVVDAGIWSDAVRTRQSILVNDYRSPFEGKKGYPKGHIHIDRFMSVPIFDGHKVVAVAGVANKRTEYNRSDVRLVRLIMDGVWRLMDRQKSQRALETSEQKYRRLFQKAGDAVFLHTVSDKDGGRFLEVNDLACEMLGYEREALLELRPSQVVRPLHRSMGIGTGGESGGWQSSYEGSLVTSTGRRIPAEIGAHTFVYEGEMVVLSMVRDVSERKALESAWRKYEFIANSSGDFMTLVDRDYRYEAVNDAYAGTMPGGREALMGKTVANVWGQTAFESGIRPQIDRCFAGETVNYEGWFDFHGRGRGYYEVSCYPYANSNGDVTHVAVVSHDITARKQTEEKLRESLREKDILLQEVHHRVKNNLNIVTSLLDMAGRRFADTEAGEVCRDLRSKIYGMAVIHTQLYDSDSFDSVNIGSYSRTLCQQLAQMYSAGHIVQHLDVEDIYLSIDTAIPCALIINELLTNVFRHAFPAGRSGEVWFHLAKDDEGMIHLHVRDNGVGFPGNTASLITGSMGMKLVRNIAEFQLKGRLTLDEGPGASVTLIFPG